jgi:hypothetical protein
MYFDMRSTLRGETTGAASLGSPQIVQRTATLVSASAGRSVRF